MFPIKESGTACLDHVFRSCFGECRKEGVSGIKKFVSFFLKINFTIAVSYELFLKVDIEKNYTDFYNERW